MLAAVDALEAHIIVDNVTDSLSTGPEHVETEFAFLRRNGMRVLGGRCLCCAAHGLSCLLTARRGDRVHTVLFDTGPDADVFVRNVDRLGLDLTKVEAMVLSHGHWDHAGGMLRALELVRAGNRNLTIPFYAHPGMFRSRGIKRPDGAVQPMADVPSVVTLTEYGADVVLATEPRSFLDDMFLVSGEIPRVTSFEAGFPGHMQKTPDGLGWQPDPLIMDERWLGVHVQGRGLIVFTACSHAGVVNVLEDARAKLPDVPLHTVLGGLHLAGATEKIIPDTVQGLKKFELSSIAAGHCTGWRAFAALSIEFGDRVVTPLAVGKRFSF